MADVVADLHALGHHRVVVAGLCAGAWMGLAAAEAGGPDGVIALNPQLYWQPGDPVEASIVNETRPRRCPGDPPPAPDPPDGGVVGTRRGGGPARRRRTLRTIDRLGTPTLVVFAEGDDGLEYLEDRVGRTWASVLRHGHIVLATIPGIDHSMHRVWLRPALTEVLLDWLDRFCTDGAASPPGAGRPGERPAGPA